MLDNFATGRRENLAARRRGRRPGRGRHPELRARPQRRPRLRGRLPPGGAALGAAIGPGPADQQRVERDRHAEHPARRARRGRAPRGLRLVVLDLRREHRAAEAGGHGRRCRSRPTRSPSWPREGYCRAFFHVYGLETVALRYFNVFGPRQDPLSQYAAVIPRFITAMLAGRVADHLRRRRAVARLHLHRQRGRAPTCSPLRRRQPGRRRDVQHRLRRADQPQRPDRGAARGQRHPESRPSTPSRASGRRPALARGHLPRPRSGSATSPRSGSARGSSERTLTTSNSTAWVSARARSSSDSHRSSSKTRAGPMNWVCPCRSTTVASAWRRPSACSGVRASAPRPARPRRLRIRGSRLRSAG